MDPKFAKAIQDGTPKINERIGNGLAYHESPTFPAFVDRLIRINHASYPIGFKYLGIEPATVEESYKFATRLVNNNIRYYDVNRSDLRLYRLLFEYEKQTIVKYLYIPFITRHSFMYMNGVKYIVTPVLADGIITVKPNSIFVKLVKTKLWFYYLNHAVKVDGNVKYYPIYYSEIHKKKPGDDKARSMIKMKTTLVNYMCAKFGLTKTLEMYGLKENDWGLFTQESFDEVCDQYPFDDWVKVETMGTKPRQTYGYPYYEPSQMFFLVKRDLFENNKLVSSAVSAALYVMAHYTNLQRLNPYNIDNPDTWSSILGEAIYSTTEHPSNIRKKMGIHLVSIDGYVDHMVVDDFSRIGLGHITDIYKLFIYITNNFQEMVSAVDESNGGNTLYNKQLQVAQFLLFDITKCINNVFFELNNLKYLQQQDGQHIRLEAIQKSLNKIKPNVVTKIKTHAEIIVADDPGDNPLIKMGRIVTPQEKSDTLRTKNVKFSVDNPINILHESLPEVGAAFDMSKSDPSGRSRLNPYVTITEENIIVPNPELKPIIDSVKALLRD